MSLKYLIPSSDWHLSTGQFRRSVSYSLYFLLQVPVSFDLTLFITEEPQVEEHVVQDCHSLQEQLSELSKNNDMPNLTDSMSPFKDGTNYNESNEFRELNRYPYHQGLQRKKKGVWYRQQLCKMKQISPVTSYFS